MNKSEWDRIKVDLFKSLYLFGKVYVIQTEYGPRVYNPYYLYSEDKDG